MNKLILILLFIMSIVLVGCAEEEKVYIDAVIVGHHTQVSIDEGKKTVQYFIEVENDTLSTDYIWRVEVEVKSLSWGGLTGQFPLDADIRVELGDLIRVEK